MNVLCLSLKDDIRKKKRKLYIYCLLNKKKKKFALENSLCTCLCEVCKGS